MKRVTRWTLVSLLVATGFGLAATLASSQQRINAGRPEVSPDGKLIVGATADLATRSFGAFVMNSDGSNRRNLPVSDATWFPDGSKLLAIKTYGRDDRAVIVLNADGTGETEIGIRGAIGDAQALPGGRLLLARTTRVSGRSIINWQWFTRAQDGTETPLQFKVPSGQTVFRGVEPSNDGTRVAFLALRLSDSSHKAVLYVMNIDGSGMRQLADVQQDAGGISWSRDNQTLALSDSYTPHPPPDGFVSDAVIISVDVASGAVRRLTPHDRRLVDEHPSWSPDGSIYFQSDRDGAVEIFRMNRDGSQQRRITNGPPG